MPMDDVFVYLVPLPSSMDEIVLPCLDGHTVYINSRLSYDGQIKAYKHALDHIENLDFEIADVQEIEYEAHRREMI